MNSCRTFTSGKPLGGLLFVLLYGLGNGMLTIVQGTAIAQYVSRDHVASLNGALPADHQIHANPAIQWHMREICGLARDGG